MSSRFRFVGFIIANFTASDNELSWWKDLNLDPLPIALRFWQLTRGLLEPISEGAKTGTANTWRLARAPGAISFASQQCASFVL